MWKKVAVQAGFMALDYGLRKRKQKKTANKKRKTTTKSKKRG